jgi:hypothetical protein
MSEQLDLSGMSVLPVVRILCMSSRFSSKIPFTSRLRQEKVGLSGTVALQGNSRRGGLHAVRCGLSCPRFMGRNLMPT